MKNYYHNTLLKATKLIYVFPTINQQKKLMREGTLTEMKENKIKEKKK